MKLILIKFLAAVLLVAIVSGGGLWFLAHRPNPAREAAELEARGDLRASLLLRRNDVANHPTDAGARLRLAEGQLRVYDPVSAEKSFRAAEDLGADHWAVLLGIGEAEIQQGAWQRLLQDLSDTAPDPGIAARLRVLRATTEIALNRIPAATATLAVARRVSPGSIPTLLIAARLALATHDVAAAEASTAAALQLDQDDVEALFLKLRLAAGRNDAKTGLKTASHLIAVAPWSLPARLNRADLYLAADEDASARIDVDSVLARAPRNPGARYLEAVLLARAQRDMEASAALERLEPLVPVFPRILLIHAIVAERLGQSDTALRLAARYNARLPGNRDGILLLARMQIAARHPDRAVPLLEQATTGKPADAPLLALLGSAYAQTGNQAAALRVREAAVAAAPDDPLIRSGLGLSQLSQGNVTAALDTLELAAEQAPPPDGMSDMLFGAALGVGDLDRAAAALARRRAQDGDTEEVATMTALLQLAQGNDDGALESFEAEVKAYPASTAPRVALAKTLLAQGKVGEAESLLTAALEKDPTDRVALSGYLEVMIAQKKFDQALRAVDVAEAADPKEPVFVALHIKVMIRAGDAAAAAALLQDRRDAKTLNQRLLPLLARAQAAAGQTAAAIATYSELLTENPNSDAARFAQVRLLVADKRPAEAEASLRQAIILTPGRLNLLSALVSVELRTTGLDAALKLAAALRADAGNMPAAALLQGDLFMQAQQAANAAKAYHSELDLAPSQVIALRLSRAEALAGNLDAGAAVLRNWSVAHPNDPDIERRLASIYLLAQHWDLAQTELETYLRHRPIDAGSLNDLAWVYQLKNDPRALELAKRAYALQPSPLIADTLGWIMLAHGNVSAAVTTLRLAVSQAPGNPALTYHLAAALQKDGKPDDSMKLLTPILARQEPFDDRQAAEQLMRDLKGGKL